MALSTLTLTDFLLARIAEDEAAANDARRLQDYMPSGAWDLDRVLAECEAKRRIVDCADPLYGMGRLSLLALAAVYADHDDFQEAWRV